LDLDRLRRGQLQPEREPTDVGELADRVALELPSLSGHPIRIESEPMLVDVDRAKVERIVENLLNNAARHTPAGTPVQVLIIEQGPGVVVVVEDEGPRSEEHRLNSSHDQNSYAVFCLKKKK